MSRSTRVLTAITGSVAAVALLAIGAGSVGATGSGRADSGTLYLAVTHIVGNKQYAAGNSYDKLFGTGAVTYVNVATGTPTGTVTVTTKPVVIFYKDGTLTGSATSTLTVGAKGGCDPQRRPSDGRERHRRGEGPLVHGHVLRHGEPDHVHVQARLQGHVQVAVPG